MQETAPSPELRRCLGLREAITITTGTVIGVGLFTVGANVVGLLGPTVIFATLTALIISIYPSLLYAEMGAALPLSGGTYQYASLGLGRVFGVLSGWCFLISMVSVASGEALAFSFYIRTLFEALGIPLPVDDRYIACLAVAGFLILAIGGVQMTGRLQNGFLFFFWGVTIVWIVSILPSMHGGEVLTVPSPNSLTLSGFLPCVAMIWWCFAGFETCCSMGEEIRHPSVNLPRALILAPFLVFAVTGLFQWALLRIVPNESLSSLADTAAPYADGMRLAGIVGFPLILLCLGIAFGGDFSTLNASVSAPARYLYSMAKDGAMPAFLGRLHPRFRTPVPAVLILGGLMLLLISTNSLSIIASLSLFATLLYYVIGIAAACGLRIRKPELSRPFRAPFLWIGAPISILIYLLLMTQLDRTAVTAGILWCLLGLFVFALCKRKHRDRENMFPLFLRPDPPTPDKKRRLDREFHIWCAIVAAAALLVLCLHLTLLL
ncbi:MAG: APC family permease [Clostridiales bacterium]|nr:APC family permease [Clostridiales bacterium]